MKIALACDHGGLNLKNAIKNHLEKKGYEVLDFGTDTTDSVDYPDFAYKAAKSVVDKESECGILVCGTGIGIGIAANKVKGIRCATLGDTFSARMTKAHNDANMIALGERVTGIGLGLDIVDAYLNSSFEGGRHQSRVDKITDIESNNL
ncbi:ribose 5-phosphate isomerase B [Peptostreptococcus porci]|uniref:ribose 5-phosphate isomerase B n=1 Tax=Peptostreptococcus porci TaxID=2652282 RepID=UPI0023F484BC|nr:ribose 5-phosphate isomerase B [Peptostreptococcus porci]MDD7183547.1 ribose 5-phosphate isomerase B [Peptostreptococcus porci]MDY4128552.1 ribose 5-phosphate isomerase B [Peptostreptococcus porci]MDY5965002.1 ribose 5-phosphate isomerase B [Peptostreptococcus porci]